jgi:polyisoprenoid-binding protein YceI
MIRLTCRAAAIAALAFVALAGAAHAAPAPHWTVDPASKLGFTGKFGGEAFNGAFRRWTAQIAFDPRNLAGSSVQVSIDMTSATTGDNDRDSALPGPDWFAAAKFPRASFVTREIKDLGGGRFQAIGDLTIRGVSHPVALPFTLAISGDTARMNGQLAINRTAFGVGQGQWKTGETIDTQVVVGVALTAHRVH